jgi:DNA-directed RNA polymerase-3 subunit RPC5
MDEDDIFVSQEDRMEADTQAAPTMPRHDDHSENQDPVVQEFPIFVSHGLDGKINLFQYPTRTANRSHASTGGPGVVSSRLKQNSAIVEVDIPLDTAKFYDKDKAEKWRGVNKQSFGGVLKQSNGRYMIGVFKNGELHVSPVESVVQLRPQFKYFSKHVSEEKEATRLLNSDLTRPREAKSIQVSARSTGELAPKYSGALSAYKASEEEEQVPLDWFDRDSDEAWEVSERFISSSRAQLISKTKIKDYIQFGNW